MYTSQKITDVKMGEEMAPFLSLSSKACQLGNNANIGHHSIGPISHYPFAAYPFQGYSYSLL